MARWRFELRHAAHMTATELAHYVSCGLVEGIAALESTQLVLLREQCSELEVERENQAGDIVELRNQLEDAQHELAVARSELRELTKKVEDFATEARKYA